MHSFAIEVENLSKSYRVGHKNPNNERYTSLRDVIVRDLKTFSRKTLDFLKGNAVIPGDGIEEFWALKDISFSIKPGDRVGIIGGNGAGKSTLLKILSRITEPTIGRIRINGRIASLLEVGTGFHPELTGRENIFLNGAVLGMSRKEILHNFDEIVSFADIEKFIDTPVKRYSSGMYVRLAFSVAAHLNPEILIIDEVLAVGDAAFQEKCLGKLDQISDTGRTILFVSHDISALQRFCTRGILINSGHLALDDDLQSVTTKYLEDQLTLNQLSSINCGTRIIRVWITDDQHAQCNIVTKEKTININFEINNESPISNLGFTIYKNNHPAISSSALETLDSLPLGVFNLKIQIQTDILTPGKYFIEGAIWDAYETYYQNDNLASFSVAIPSTKRTLRSEYKAPLKLPTNWIINDSH